MAPLKNKYSTMMAVTSDFASFNQSNHLFSGFHSNANLKFLNDIGYRITSYNGVNEHLKGLRRDSKTILNGATLGFFKKNGPNPASFCLFPLFSRYNFNNTN